MIDPKETGANDHPFTEWWEETIKGAPSEDEGEEDATYLEKRN